MGKKKIVVDTNTLISAFGWAGKPNELLSRILSAEYVLFISKETLAELKRVIDYPKFGFSREQKDAFVEMVAAMGILVEPRIRLDVIKDDLTDNRFLELALEANADYIITGDHHLLELKKYNGIRILTVSEFLS